MYQMKSIVDHSSEIILPKCMYRIRNPNETLKDEINLNICNQAPNNKMSELEQRQEVLIQKLDVLYDRIQTISSYCKIHKDDDKGIAPTVPVPEEVVLIVDPDNLPWYLKKILNDPTLALNLTWHIHSSISNEKVPKIKAFGNSLKFASSEPKVNLRLIFKNVSSNSELKLTSLAMPIIGTVNILRYLSYIYPKALPYDDGDHEMNALLDVCHMIENSSDKNKESIAVKQLFSKCKDWIHNNKYSIVDLATYNIMKKSKSSIKLVPKVWFEKCEKLCA